MRNGVLAISISLRERVSIRETLSPLDEPSTHLEKSEKVEGDRAGPPAAMRRTRRPPPWGDGAIAYSCGPGSRTRPQLWRRGVSPAGGISGRGYPGCGGCSDGVCSEA